MAEMREKRWAFLPQDLHLQSNVSRSLGISPLTAQVLINRGIKNLDQARLFLQPRLDGLHDASMLPDMDRAVSRLCQAVRQKESVLLYGDYDVDGLCSVALLKELLELAGLRPLSYIPNRQTQGYGLHGKVLEQFRHQVSLVVTVDCGIRAVEEAKQAKRLGLDLIIVDHHEPGSSLPDACAVVDPKRDDSRYPFPDLAAVGVTYKFACEVARKLWGSGGGVAAFQDFLLNGLALVGLGTVADVVPLLGENRILTEFGLQALQATELAGIRKLIFNCGLAQSPLTAEDIAYRLGPRLNAAGRMGEADLSLELLCCRSPRRAEELVTMLEERNRQRQKLQANVLSQAEQMIARDFDLHKLSAIVLAHPEWPVGVVGIVASRLVERYYRPAVLLAVGDNVCQGSARSIPELPLLEVLEECGDLLSGFGGHARAGGMSLPQTNLESFRLRFTQKVADRLGSQELTPEVTIDAEVPLDYISSSMVGELQRLAPFGEGNRLPVFACQGVKVAGVPRRMGSAGKHLSFYAAQGGTSLRTVGFNMGNWLDELNTNGGNISIAFTPRMNQYRGRRSVELHLVDIKVDKG